MSLIRVFFRHLTNSETILNSFRRHNISCVSIEPCSSLLDDDSALSSQVLLSHWTFFKPRFSYSRKTSLSLLDAGIELDPSEIVSHYSKYPMEKCYLFSKLNHIEVFFLARLSVHIYMTFEEQHNGSILLWWMKCQQLEIPNAWLICKH